MSLPVNGTSHRRLETFHLGFLLSLALPLPLSSVLLPLRLVSASLFTPYRVAYRGRRETR